MSDTAYTCSKCASPMVKGYAAGHGDGAALFQSLWFDGEPAKKNIWGITGENLEVDRRQKKTVRGLRCTHCGYLELYAV